MECETNCRNIFFKINLTRLSSSEVRFCKAGISASAIMQQLTNKFLLEED